MTIRNELRYLISGSKFLCFMIVQKHAFNTHRYPAEYSSERVLNEERIESYEEKKNYARLSDRHSCLPVDWIHNDCICGE